MMTGNINDRNKPALVYIHVNLGMLDIAVCILQALAVHLTDPH